MLQWKEFTAWVSIEGKEAKEYDVKTSEKQKTVTCWIASELGKKLAINWTNKKYSSHDTAGYVTIDGIECGAEIIEQDESLPQTAEISGVSNGSTIRPFMFSALELTDDDALLASSSSHQDLGMIELTIIPVKVISGSVPAVPRFSKLKIHEQSKKTVTQQITLAKPKRCAKQQGPGSVTTEPAGQDIVNFCFKYRPIDVLRANGIAPPLPQLHMTAAVDLQRASTSNDDDDDDDPDVKEAKVLRDKLKVVEAKIASKKDKKPRIKRESSDLVDVTQDVPRCKKVKLEGRSLFAEREIIDLT
ncbi:hypothetical protein GGX14DRAFT_445715 [Mycena pura]|uniref:DUF7918 domain-containing protein n=1 Tax=Mycena pura TaxID=153505 RepID=A0AAD6YES3_9AGAR|nr:hypothetical protein GGX14DRAFT_445715 [Mycena pura]